MPESYIAAKSFVEVRRPPAQTLLD
jgi:hypothetical protein